MALIVAETMTDGKGITIHWIDNDFCQRSAVLQLEPITGHGTGRNLSEAFEETLSTFGVWPRIAHITTDGGSDFLLMLRSIEPSWTGGSRLAASSAVKCITSEIYIPPVPRLQT
jgi:hypothetical protein